MTSLADRHALRSLQDVKEVGPQQELALAAAFLYFHEVRARLDAEFGDGYADRNPVLVGSLVEACVALRKLAADLPLSSRLPLDEAAAK